MRFAEWLGVRHPVIQAPMAGVQGTALAAAVSDAGGLGSLPCALLSADALRAELADLRSRTDRPFNVNFFAHTQPEPDAAMEHAWRARLEPYYRERRLDVRNISPGARRLPFNQEMADAIAARPPAIVSFHFGLPASPLVQQIKRGGSKVLASATTREEAEWLQAHGADAVIAQGLEAGGHRGLFLSADLTLQMGTLALLPQIVSAVRVPVIAAGGIADASGVRAAVALGAAAVQVGTAYLLCHEATTSAVHRAALSSPAAGHTAVTNVFTGRPARGIVNRLMRELGPLRGDVPAFPLAADAIAPLRATAEAAGSDDFSPLWAGQNVTGCRNTPAAEVTLALAAGFE